MEYGILKTLLANVIIAAVAGFAALHFMKQFIPIFIQRKLFGLDQCKVNRVPVAEPIGVVAAAVYLIFVFLFIPIPFYEWSNEDVAEKDGIFYQAVGLNNTICSEQGENTFAYIRLMSLLAAIISICTSILLGFADDILDLRWRHKLIFPTLSSLPLLLVYHISRNSTAMLLPDFVQRLVGETYLDLGPLFYVYMMMLVIFCTNAINIIAGINGVEAGQSMVIAASVALFNFVQIWRLERTLVWYHSLSLCILLPFIATSFALYSLNKYPAKVFVGDTYCYWAGMTLAVVAIIGHFSKTLILFLAPQILNFLYSVPQLFHLIPCPRHRLPKLNTETGKLGMSMAEFEPAKLSGLGRICLRVLIDFGLVYSREFEKDDEKWMEINNLTILNFLLKVAGPMHESELTNLFLKVQLASSVLAFVCRFYFSYLLYGTVN